MNISQTSGPSKPTNGDRIPLETLIYFRSRSKFRAFSLVLRELKRNGLSQADLARRLGKKPSQISRMLGGPGNWTLDTLSDLLFAISASEPTYSLDYPLDRPKRNDVQPDWLREVTVASSDNTGNEMSRPHNKNENENAKSKSSGHVDRINLVNA